MLKKSEVLTVLSRGGYIMINEVYRSATVYDITGERLDVCRYDTAENIEKLPGYGADKKLDPWSYTRQVCDITVRRELIAAAAQQLDDITTPGHIYIKALCDHYVGDRRVKAGTTFVIQVYGNGVHSSPGNAYGTLYDFRSKTHAHLYSIIDFK